MAKLTTNHLFNGSIKQVFKALSSYEKYPEYIPGVNEIKVLPSDKEGVSCQVRYEVKVIKTIFYTLEMHVEEPNKIWWSLVDSNILKKNDGSWTLKKRKNGVDAEYCLDVAFKGFVPKAITDKVTQANLPGMFKGFQDLIDS